MKISDLTDTYLWEPQSSSVTGLGCDRVSKPVSTQLSPASSGGLPFKHYCGSGWRFGDICLVVYASFCDGNGVEVWVGLCFWTLTRTSARGGNGHCYGVYLVLAVMFTGVVLAVAYNPLRR